MPPDDNGEPRMIYVIDADRLQKQHADLWYENTLERHKLARLNVLSVVHSRRLFMHYFERWQCCYVNMDEVKAVCSDILGCFSATLEETETRLFGVAPPPAIHQ